MELYLKLLLCVLCYASSQAYESRERDDIRRDVQEYLRSFTQQQPFYSAQPFQPILNSHLFPHPALRLPASGGINQAYAEGGVLPVNNDENKLQTWPVVPFESSLHNEGVRNSDSSYSLNDQQPNLDSLQFPSLSALEIGKTNAAVKASAFASAKDVDAEEHLEEYDRGTIHENARLPTIMEPEKKSPHPQPVQHTVAASETLARKSETASALHQQKVDTTSKENNSFSDVYFVAVVAGCSAAAIFGVISAGYCFYRLQKSSKAAAEVDYPAYGVTGPSKDASSPNGDRKLAQSAQMYHYQHQKQQMIAVEKAGSTRNTSASDVDSEEENEEGDYTVYECPGLAPTGEMEVKNPLFNDDSTPLSPPVLPCKPDGAEGK